jgi:CheY-like chemotaxis protein
MASSTSIVALRLCNRLTLPVSFCAWLALGFVPIGRRVTQDPVSLKAVKLFSDRSFIDSPSVFTLFAQPLSRAKLVADEHMKMSQTYSVSRKLDAQGAGSVSGNRPKILIVDDDPVVHLLYGRCLQREGYQVIDAVNGREGIEMAAREKPQVVIMDIMMPGMDGLAAARELNKSPECGAIVVVTANPLYDVCQHESQQSGASCFMTKPFSPASLLELVRELLCSNDSSIRDMQ